MSRAGDFELVTLRNGHRAVRHVGHGEVMHPAVGPWREANRLYVEQLGLAARLAGSAAKVRVWDVGLGGGANAVAALTCAKSLPSRAPLEVVSFEVDVKALQLALTDEEGFPFLGPWRDAAAELLAEGRSEAEGLCWRLERGDLLETMEKAPGPADLVFFDPFSPEKNPSLWTRHALRRLRGRCREDGAGALLSTYSASTRTRASLLLAGFFVGTGVSVGTKKETTVAATRLESLGRPLGSEWLARWRRSSARAPHGEDLTAVLERALLANVHL